MADRRTLKEMEKKCREIGQKWPTKIRCFIPGSCHLMADTFEELHAFARKLGLKRAWFQPHPRWPHYDLTVRKRARAVELGAKEVTRDFIPKIRTYERAPDFFGNSNHA